MEPFAALGKRIRSRGVLHKFDMTAKQIRKALEYENSLPEKNEERIRYLKDMLEKR